jgi:hypothetical protein
VTRPQPGGSVVVDTSVFGADLLKVRALLAESYQPFLVGRAVFISFVTWPNCAMAPGAPAGEAHACADWTRGSPVPRSSGRVLS